MQYPSGRRVGLITSQAFSLTNFRGQLISQLVRGGARVYALAPDFEAATRARVENLGAIPVDFSMQRAGVSPLGDLGALVSLVRALRPLQLDATLNYFIKPVIYGTLAARICGVRRIQCLVEGAGNVFAQESAVSPAARFAARSLYRFALRFATRVGFLNEDDRRLFRQKGLVRAEQAWLMGPIGVDLLKFSFSPPPTKPFTFLMAARMIQEKGVREFVEAARLIKAEGAQARFVLAGGLDANPSSINAAEMQAFIDEGSIEWRGHVEDMQAEFARCTVFVLPSYYREGVPRSIQEAMAVGRPILTTDWIGCRETVEEGRNGLLVPPRDVENLARAMRFFLENPGTAAQFGAASRAMAEERYDGEGISRRMIAELGLL